jgi:transposase
MAYGALPGTAVDTYECYGFAGTDSLSAVKPIKSQEHEEVPMAIVGGIDVHRRQLTFDYCDRATGELCRGRIAPADRQGFRSWLSLLPPGGDFALEGCTGWRYIVEELAAAGFVAHLAEPADTAALRGNKQRAKTDRADARHLRELLMSGTLPESWIPPAHVLEARTTVRLYKDLSDERGAWTQRIHAALFHQGVETFSGTLASDVGRVFLDKADLSPAARRAVETGFAHIETLNKTLTPIKRDLSKFSIAQPGCSALREYFGIGGLLSVAIWAEMGDTRRFSSSSDAVRHTGLDITVYSSDTKRAKGHLSRQGPSVLRWALYEAAKSAAKPAAPDHEYYVSVRERLGAQRATLSVARKIARWVHHRLRELGDEAFAPV